MSVILGNIEKFDTTFDAGELGIHDGCVWIQREDIVGAWIKVDSKQSINITSLLTEPVKNRIIEEWIDAKAEEMHARRYQTRGEPEDWSPDGAA